MKEKIRYNISASGAGQKIIEERAINLAHYIIESKDTVRGAAKKFRYIKINSTQRCNRKTKSSKSIISDGS